MLVWESERLREPLWGAEANYGEEVLKLFIYLFSGVTDHFSE